MSNLLVRGASILDPVTGLTEADLLIDGGRITEVGSRLPAAGVRVLDADGMLAMPGLINAHTHSGQALDRGSTPDLPLDLWLTRVVLAEMERSLDDVYTTAAAGALEMLRTGCTAVLDHVFLDYDDFSAHADAVISAYRDVGIRAAVAPMAADLGHAETWPTHLLDDEEQPPPPTPRHDPQRLAGLMETFIEEHLDRDPRLNPVLGPNAPQRCTDEYLALNARIAESHGVGVHTHLLETKSQRIATLARYGESVVDHLDATGLLGPRTSLAHGVWLSPEDIATIARRDAIVVHNPVSNLRLGSGIMPMQQMLEAEVTVAVGADGAASNDSQNMFEAWKIGTVVHTLRGPFQSWPTPSRVWRGMLAGGARALAFNIGRLSAGALADLVLLRLDRHIPSDVESLTASLAFAEHGGSVEVVIVHGEVVWAEGRSTRVDEAAIGRSARAFQRRLRETATARYREVEGQAERLTALEAVIEQTPTTLERRLRPEPDPQ
jgi:5-methylthioadenosine/S-adenosylhomocysteine deaminase